MIFLGQNHKNSTLKDYVPAFVKLRLSSLSRNVNCVFPSEVHPELVRRLSSSGGSNTWHFHYAVQSSSRDRWLLAIWRVLVPDTFCTGCSAMHSLYPQLDSDIIGQILVDNSGSWVPELQNERHRHFHDLLGLGAECFGFVTSASLPPLEAPFQATPRRSDQIYHIWSTVVSQPEYYRRANLLKMLGKYKYALAIPLLLHLTKF